MFIRQVSRLARSFLLRVFLVSFAFAVEAFPGQATELEVVAARTSIAGFQRRPQDLLRALAAGEEKKAGREMVFDLPLTVTHVFGAGAWEKFDAKQREAIGRAFERATAEQLEDWAADAGIETRLLREEAQDNRATLLTLRGADLIRLTLASRDGAWFVVEIEDLDSSIPILGQSLRGAIDPRSDRWHILALDPDQALKRFDELIAAEGENPELLTLKAITLGRRQFVETLGRKSAANGRASGRPDKAKPDEAKPDKAKPDEAKPDEAKPDEANALYERIIERWPNFAPAYYLFSLRLAADEERARKVKLLERYARLVRFDPRPWREMAAAFEALNEPVSVETAYREAIARDQSDHSLRIQLVVFNLRQSQLEKAKLSFAESFKSATAEKSFEALDEWIVSDLDEDAEPAQMSRYESMLLAFPKEIAASPAGSRALARVQQAQNKNLEAIKNLEIAVTLRSNADDYAILARLNRALKRGRPALLAAEQGVKLEKDSLAAHLERAYALVLLNRASEAITALKRALEISPELRESLADAEELKPIAELPAFKALVAVPAEPAKPAQKP
jgi:tetratricopeptide (TPR) repeat protein